MLSTPTDALDLVQRVGLNLLPTPIAGDVEVALSRALAAGAVMDGGSTPLDVFRHGLARSIRAIEGDPRGDLLLRFLKLGPYDRHGEIPEEVRLRFLSDHETAKAVSFIRGHMVSSFQGRLAEWLSLRPALVILESLERAGLVPADTRLFVGDTVTAPRLAGDPGAQAADLHLLVPREVGGIERIEVVGVGEVKSYRRSVRRIRDQLDQHLLRAQQGLCVRGRTYGADHIDCSPAPLRLAFVPDAWRLPRSFRLVPVPGGERLELEDPTPRHREDQIEKLPGGSHKVTLRWSVEALAAAAYEMTFWYMGQLGTVLYRDGVPPEWSSMTPEQAGRNNADQMLRCALLRARTRAEDERAIALYNIYGFGFALGSSFRDETGRRELLEPFHVRELARARVTTDGARFWGVRGS